MRAYSIEDQQGWDALRLVERPEPTPAIGQVIVRVRAVSLNYRDLIIARGMYSGGTKPLGRIPVSDGAGEVVRVGPGVDRVKIGDRVAAAFMSGWIDGPLTAEKQMSSLGGDGADGMLAELVCLDQSALVRIPDHLSFEEAATLPCAGVTAWYALFEGANVQPGTSVLLLGTGGVSIFGLQLARLAGARTFITSSSDEKLARAKSLGADVTINYSKEPDWHKRVLAETDGRGVDHAVEVGGPGTLNKTLACVRFSGSIALMGVLTGLNDRVDTAAILHRNIKIQGTYVGSRSMFERLNTAIDQSGLRPVIDRVFDFADARKAYEFLESGKHFGKVVIAIK